MKPFEIHLSTKIKFGSGVLASVGEEVKALGTRALLLYGGGSIKRNGVYDTVMSGLREAGVAVSELGGVKPNPVVSHAREAIRLAKEAEVDVIVAVGGGSVIDEAKAVAVGARDEGDVWDFYARSRTASEGLPIVAVQTLPASSSEVNPASVVTNEETREKIGLRHPAMMPKVAFLDPAVTTTIPIEYTAYACTDILSHMMEGYFTSADRFAPVADGMWEGVSRAVMESMERLLVDPTDLAARSALMWAGTLSWSGVLNAGVEGAAIPNHMIEHPLSGHYDIAHGAGLSIVFPAWMRFARHRHGDRIIRFGRKILGLESELDGLSHDEQVEATAVALERWYRHIGTPTTFAEAEIHDPDVAAMTAQAMTLSRMWGISGYSEDDVRAVYALCDR